MDSDVSSLHPDLLTGLKVAHFSDSHVGYEAYRSLSVSGENQRGVDIAKAFKQVCEDIISWDPALVVHTGDVAERPHIPVRLMLLIRKWFTEISAIRPDGTRRQLVVIAGNHELPSARREACFLELYRGLPGVHVVTDDYRQVRFADAGEEGGAAAELADVVVHCLPHDTLKDLAVEQRFDEVTPIGGKVNILAAHGVAGGSGLYKRILGREFAIPTDVLARRWDYGALGHWHRQGPVPIVAAGGARDGSSGRIWYAGSSENCGFGDVLDNGAKRGYLRVTVTPAEMPVVERRNLPIRTMFRLPVLEGAGMAPEEIADELRARIRDARTKGTLDGSVVGQIVKGVPRDIWSLVDVVAVRDAAAGALHYDVTAEPVARSVEDGGEADESEERRMGLGDVGAILVERAEEILPKDQVAATVALARELLGKYLAESPADDDSEVDDPTAVDSEAGTGRSMNAPAETAA